MKIGNIEFGDKPLFLAPMEDVTDIGFRMLCKRFGAAMVYTEFVSAEALVRSVKAGIPIGDITSILFQMEMMGVVKPMAGGNYHLLN